MNDAEIAPLADDAIAARLRQAVHDLNAAIADATSVGMETTFSTVDHQSVGSLIKRPIVSARLMRPVAAS